MGQNSAQCHGNGRVSRRAIILGVAATALPAMGNAEENNGQALDAEIMLLASALIREFEGVELRGYRDLTGVWTIGAGITEQSGAVGKITSEMTLAAEDEVALFQSTLWAALEELRSMVAPRGTSYQIAAMLSLAWNIGGGQFYRSSVRRNFNAQDYQSAADAFLLYTRARLEGALQIVPGLERRRRAERDLFLGQMRG